MIVVFIGVARSIARSSCQHLADQMPSNMGQNVITDTIRSHKSERSLISGVSRLTFEFRAFCEWLTFSRAQRTF
jgi:hypothetical protein